MQEAAPKTGYDFGAKRQYRRDIWSVLRGAGDGPVALLASSEGNEIEYALGCGFREEQLHVINDNPAIVATHKRKYPDIHTYGVAASRACRRIAQKGVSLKHANFDFTGCVSFPLLNEWRKCIINASWSGERFWAVNVQRGRERDVSDGLTAFGEAVEARRLSDLWGERVVNNRPLQTRDYGRLWFLASDLWELGPVRLIRAGIYKSNRVTMLFSVWGVRSVEWKKRELKRLWNASTSSLSDDTEDRIATRMVDLDGVDANIELEKERARLGVSAAKQFLQFIRWDDRPYMKEVLYEKPTRFVGEDGLPVEGWMDYSW